MLARILQEALRRKPRRMLMAVLGVTAGAALAAALLNLSLDIGDKMARELRSYGANLLIQPKTAAVRLEIGGASLSPPSARGAIDEKELVKLKTIFWRHNILGFAPFLSAAVEAGGSQVVLTGTWFDKPLALPYGFAARGEPGFFSTGIRTIAPWWQVQGGWVGDEELFSAMVGATLATRLGLRIGDSFTVRAEGRTRLLKVRGLVTTGGSEEEQIFVSLPTAQGLLGLSRGADRVLVSALVQPDSTLRADLRGLDPSEMTPEQYETWYCSPIIGAVVTQIEEVLAGVQAKPIRRIAEAEGAFLSKLGLLMTLLAAAALAAAGLAVMTAMTASVVERRAEIGLIKSIGADSRQVALIFLSEAALIGLAGGLLGYLAGLGLTGLIGRQIFSAAVTPQLLVLPLTVFLGLSVALLGSALPVRRAMRLDPVILLRGR